LRILRKYLATAFRSITYIALQLCNFPPFSPEQDSSYNPGALARSHKFGLAAAGLIFVVLVVYWSLHLGQVKVEVCIEFRDRSNCGTAAAPTEEEAIRTATDNACALISSGMTDSIACSRTPPSSVRRLD
jgi:hypothetical protein